MNFISTKGMTNETAPDGEVLVQFLSPFFGSWVVNYTIGFYDNPNEYDSNDDNERGWKIWHNEKQINVIAYAVLPEVIKTPLADLTQIQFKEKFGSFHPNMGCVGE